MQPLATINRRYHIKLQVYDDDTQMYFDLTEAAEVTAFPGCLEEINRWMSANFLKRNGAKTENMIFSDQTCPVPGPLWTVSFRISPKPAAQVRDLERSCHHQLRLLRELFKFIRIPERKQF